MTDADPDLILLAGDYLHISNNAKYLIAKAALNALLWRAQLEAPLGMYSIRGNVDWGDWNELFTGLPVVDIHTTSSYDLGPLVLTGLSLEDSGNIQPDLPAQDKFHIVLGHRPDFSLGQVDADLLIAGHTHGGQVRIPFIGPLFAVSMVPRSWAFGITEIAPGKYLIVSRGIGMERANAP